MENDSDAVASLDSLLMPENQETLTNLLGKHAF